MQHNLCVLLNYLIGKIFGNQNLSYLLFTQQDLCFISHKHLLEQMQILCVREIQINITKKIKEDIIKIILIKVSNLKELWKSKYIELIFFNSFVLIASKSNSNVTKNEPFNASTSLEVYAQLMYQMNKEWQINQYQRVENVNKLGIFIRLKFDIINIDIKLCGSWPFEVYYFKCYIFIMYFLIFFICYQYFLLFLPLLYHFFEDFDYLLEDLITSCLYT